MQRSERSTSELGVPEFSRVPGARLTTDPEAQGAGIGAGGRLRVEPRRRRFPMSRHARVLGLLLVLSSAPSTLATSAWVQAPSEQAPQASPALSSEEPEAAPAPVRRALLVGIGRYPETHGWNALGGPPADVAGLNQALVARGGFRAEDVHVLLNEQATRLAMESGYHELARSSKEDDLLLFYFAGHGSRLPDDDHDEPDGWDETLIPYDASHEGEAPNDIRDDDLCAWIRAANKHTSRVVMIFDCCSSGTNVRGELAGVTRSVDPVKRGFAGRREGTRSEEGTGYFLPALSYVSLGACRASESAYEHPLEPPSSEQPPIVRGLFTWCLEQELSRAEAGTTYAELGDRVRGAVLALQPAQNPVVEGPRAKDELFGGVSGAAVMFEIVQAEGGPEVLAGRLQGLHPGAELEVVRSEGNELRTAGRIRVDAPGVQRSRFEWVEGAPDASAASPEAIAASFGTMRAKLLQRGRLDARLAIDFDFEPEQAEAARGLVGLLEKCPSLRASRAAEAALWLELFERDGHTRVRTRAPGGVELPLGADLGSSREVERLLASLERLAVAREVCVNLRRESSAVLKIEATLVRVGEDYKELGPLERDSDGLSFVHEGERVGSTLRNRSSVPVYASLVVVSPHGKVSVFPVDEPILPDKEANPAYDMEIDPGAHAFYEVFPERFLWIATTSPQEGLEALAQASAIAPPSRGEESTSDPLATELSLAAKDEWVSKLLEVRVVANPR